MPIHGASTSLRPLAGGSEKMRLGSPSRRSLRTVAGSFSHGALGSNGMLSANAFTMALRRMSILRVPSRQGFTAPSLRASVRSKTQRSSWKRSVLPSPPHAGQAPVGWLCERSRGASGSKVRAQVSQESASERGISRQVLFSSASTTQRRLPSRKASSSESASRLRWSGPVTARSTMTSSWRSVRPTSFPSASSAVSTSPSTRTRVKPRRIKSASVSRSAEGLSRRTGATSISLVPAGRRSRGARQSSRERRTTEPPSSGQRRSPTSDHNSRA